MRGLGSSEQRKVEAPSGQRVPVRTQGAATLTVDSFGSTRSAASAELLETCGTVFLAQNTPSESKKTIPQGHRLGSTTLRARYVERVLCTLRRCDTMPSSPGLRNSFVGIAVKNCLINVTSTPSGGSMRPQHLRSQLRPFPGDLGVAREKNFLKRETWPCGLTGGGRGAQAREAGAELADKLWVMALLLTGAKGPADGHNQRRYASPVTITSGRDVSAAPRPGALKEYDRPHGWVRSCEWYPRAQLPFVLSY